MLRSICFWAVTDVSGESKNWTSLPLKMGPISCTKTSLTNYKSTPRKNQNNAALDLQVLTFDTCVTYGDRYFETLASFMQHFCGISNNVTEREMCVLFRPIGCNYCTTWTRYMKLVRILIITIPCYQNIRKRNYPSCLQITEYLTNSFLRAVTSAIPLCTSNLPLICI